jgi:hypothetical protein
MEHIAALLLIIGCSDNLSECKELPAPVPVFETAQECDAELADAMTGYVNRFPQIFAQCVSVDPALEEEDVELVWDVRQDGTLYASIEVPDIMVAGETGRGDRVFTASE